MNPVAFFATEPHFLDHLAPIVRELPADYLAGVYVDHAIADHAEARGLDPIVGVPPAGAPVVVAAIGDLRRVDDGRPLVLAEHGAGQTYSNRQPSYAGGIGRDRVVLFIVPNLHAAKRNRARYPRTPNAVVGCPKLDQFAGSTAPPDGPPVAVVSFHWRCRVAPETDTALDHFLGGLEGARDVLAAAGVELRAHAHPRLIDEAAPLFTERGLPVVADFEEVIRTAHVYGVDNSSTLFEFAALGRPVVVLNAPGYRRGVSHGLRFWDAANVGLQIDHPRELAAGFLRALEDPPELARSREVALGRVYPVRDGTSALRAAAAIVEAVVKGPCLVCATGSCACTRGGPTTVVAFDQTTRRAPVSTGTKKRYPNPNGLGFIRLSDERARRMGLIPDQDAPAEAPPEPIDAPTAHQSDVPEGALAPGGPTARARAKAAEAGSGEPATTKKRPSPGGSRRRPAQPKTGKPGAK